MFKLELLELLKNYKEADEYEQKKIKSSIAKLIKEHREDYNIFVSQADMNPQYLKILQECEKTPTEEEVEKKENLKETDHIKEFYQRWLKTYDPLLDNQNEACEKVVQTIVEFYAPNRFEVLEKLLEMNVDDRYEKFKAMVKNYTRYYFVQKVKAFRLQKEQEEMGRWKRFLFNRKLTVLYNKIGAYNFDLEFMREVMA